MVVVVVIFGGGRGIGGRRMVVDGGVGRVGLGCGGGGAGGIDTGRRGGEIFGRGVKRALHTGAASCIYLRLPCKRVKPESYSLL